MSEAAWEHVRFGDPEAWVRPDAYEASVPAKEGAHTTFLLWSWQLHADAAVTFYASAVRLETAVAVQSESQWKLKFNPGYHDVTLHWLRVVRGTERIDHRHRERMRLLQRETKLEYHVLDGNWTLVAVLDDVRPGDIIEAGYSVASRHPVTADHCELFYYVPSPVVVGNYRLQVLFATGRPAMQSKASADAPARIESIEGALTRWQWSGTQAAAAVRTPEAHGLANYLDYVWVQVSDWPDWANLAARLNGQWIPTLDGGGDALPEYPRPERVDRVAVAGLVRRIQDEFRYLSIALSGGSWTPASPAAVAGRRYGDCKDLAWLAATALRGWGLSARPILVGSRWRETLRGLLPMSSLFDHVVVEVEAEGRSRWFDLTMRSQGGDFDSQPITRYEAGLPIEAGASGLIAQPGQAAPSVQVINETYYLDGRPPWPTLIEVAHRFEGWQAENVRRVRLAQGPESFAEGRLAAMRRRYSKVQHVGELQWRDDRGANVVEWTEQYELPDFPGAGDNGAATFSFVNYPAVLEATGLPDDKPRRTPWALPAGTEYRHRICARNSVLPKLGTQRARWEIPEIVLTVDQSLQAKVWTKTSRMIVRAPFVPADRVWALRRLLGDFARRASFSLLFRNGGDPIRPGRSWGALPPAPASLADYAPVGSLSEYPEAEIGADWKGPTFWQRLKLGRRVIFLVLIWLLLALALIRLGCSRI